MYKQILILFLMVTTIFVTANGVLATTIDPAHTQGVTLTATVTEQCTITALPATVTFNVTNTAVATDQSETITLNDISVLSGHGVQVEIQANAASFTAPGGGTTYDCTDVSWDTGSWTNATGNASSGGLTNGSYQTVATSTADSTSMTGSVTFSLASNPGVQAGSHTLSCTWRLSSVVP